MMMSALRKSTTIMGRRISTATSRRNFASRSGDLKEFLKKDPRTIPRAAVWVVTASFLGMMLYRKAQKNEAAIEDRRNVIKQNVPPDFVEPVAIAAKATKPFAVETDKMETVSDKGLGVSDSGEGKKEKQKS